MLRDLAGQGKAETKPIGMEASQKQAKPSRELGKDKKL